MKIQLAEHFGMCFGVRDALRAAHQIAETDQVTVLGQLVHNPVVDRHLAQAGVRRGSLEDMESAETEKVVITAHGAADRDRRNWSENGFEVVDTTCPLVRKAHNALAGLVKAGCHPVVIGKADHIEVRGLTGDFPEASVIESFRDVLRLPAMEKFGVVSQTTQPIEKVRALVSHLEQCRPQAEVRFINTVCQPTKDRQTALHKLCTECEVVIAVGGRNSNNTGKLVETAKSLGARAYHVEGPDDLKRRWLWGAESVGVTAGTSTLDETVHAVVEKLRQLAR